MLNEKERKTLLLLARNTIESIFEDKELPFNEKHSDIFDQKRGVFVTLTENGNLRGCIGYILPIDTIWNSVIKMAKEAAFGDPRFYPLQKEELNLIKIEISVLSPLYPVSGPNDIVIGRDGLLVEHGIYKGVLLPQVAIEQGWDSERFFKEVCIKAGLSPSYMDDKMTKFYRFEAEIFSER